MAALDANMPGPEASAWSDIAKTTLHIVYGHYYYVSLLSLLGFGDLIPKF